MSIEYTYAFETQASPHDISNFMRKSILDLGGYLGMINYQIGNLLVHPDVLTVDEDFIKGLHASCNSDLTPNLEIEFMFQNSLCPAPEQEAAELNMVKLWDKLLSSFPGKTVIVRVDTPIVTRFENKSLNWHAEFDFLAKLFQTVSEIPVVMTPHEKMIHS